jgi:thiol:disulfide interchange protein DsbD
MQRRFGDVVARGGFALFLSLFLGGLALNLTPCVFPMLGVTVSLFGARRAEPLPRVVGHAVAYVLGICLMYTLLGVLAAFTGSLFGAALQNPLVNVGIGALLMVLALGMFGVYELQAPPWLLTRVGGANTASIAGIFVSGLAVGVIAAPCVGPFVVAALALIAQCGDVAFGARTMFTLSLGLGAPYLVLATFSNLLQALPRSGEWMVWVKKVFGVLMLALGAFYALLAVAPAWALWVAPAALVLGGAYLGFFEKSGENKTRFRWLKRVSGTAAALAGAVMVVTTPSEGIAFERFSHEALQAALAGGQVAMLDFTANWCAPCHELERLTFTDRRVRERARSFRTFRVDLTRYDSPEADRWRREYKITGVPTVVFITSDGAEVQAARVEGFLPPDHFLERMQLAGEAGQRASVAP